MTELEEKVFDYICKFNTYVWEPLSRKMIMNKLQISDYNLRKIIKALKELKLIYSVNEWHFNDYYGRGMFSGGYYVTEEGMKTDIFKKHSKEFDKIIGYKDE